MASYVPFVMTPDDCTLVNRFYGDAPLCRIPLHRMEELGTHLLGKRLWVDAGIDGFHRLLRPQPWQVNKRWSACIIDGYENSDVLKTIGRIDATRRKRARAFVEAVLQTMVSQCGGPGGPEVSWISVPQLPLVERGKRARNDVNRLLAKMTGQWKASTRSRAKLMLPLILTSVEQSRWSTTQSRNLNAALRRYEDANAEGIWVVDSSLPDHDARGTFERDRFPAIVRFHEELIARFGAAGQRPQVVAGPYWGMNLVLWARGLVDYLGIGVGRSFQYQVSAGVPSSPKAAIAISPLRRHATPSMGLRAWLRAAIKRIPSGDKAHHEISALLANFDTLQDTGVAKGQMAEQYKRWLDGIERLSPAGRPVGLYQDLSSAFVLGKTLGKLPKDAGTPSRPEAVARALMLNCL